MSEYMEFLILPGFSNSNIEKSLIRSLDTNLPQIVMAPCKEAATFMKGYAGVKIWNHKSYLYRPSRSMGLEVCEYHH